MPETDAQRMDCSGRSDSIASLLTEPSQLYMHLPEFCNSLSYRMGHHQSVCKFMLLCAAQAMLKSLPCKWAASTQAHSNPVCCSCIYSGSWDYSIRVWHRNSLDLAGILPFDDWVFSLASRGQHLLAGASSRLHVLDITTLKPLRTLWHQVCPQGFPALYERCCPVGKVSPSAVSI